MEYGCYIDGSHMSALDFDKYIYTFATLNGMAAVTDEPSDDDSEGWLWVADATIDWLNRHLADYDSAWTIHESALYYERMDYDDTWTCSVCLRSGVTADHTAQCGKS